MCGHLADVKKEIISVITMLVIQCIDFGSAQNAKQFLLFPLGRLLATREELRRTDIKLSGCRDLFCIRNEPSHFGRRQKDDCGSHCGLFCSLISEKMSLTSKLKKG